MSGGRSFGGGVDTRVERLETKQRTGELVEYTVATVPDPAASRRCQIYVSNGAAGLPIVAFSDGVNWLRCDTRTVIS